MSELNPTDFVHAPRSDLAVKYVPIDSIKMSPNNPRTHSSKQVKQIAASIMQHGFTSPILVDDHNEIIAGHGRLRGARIAGLMEVPVIRIRGLSDAAKRTLRIADNKIAANAGWDVEILAAELEFLTSVNFDVKLTGFEASEVDLLIEKSQTTTSDPVADAMAAIDPTKPVVSLRRDLWLLGKHRLFCGDATLPEDFARLMGGEKAQMAFTDPPYNVRIDGHVSGRGSIRHREFLMASGEMSKPEFTSFLGAVLARLMASSVDGSIHYVCMDWRHCGELLQAAEGLGLELKNICVWNKTNAGMGAFYRSQHEFIFVFKAGIGPHVNNFELGQHGRYRTNVWSYAGVNTLKPDRLEELSMHPTVKPVALVADAIKDCSRRGDIILDCFAGSGTTIIAAQKTGRRAYAMELDARYVDTAVRRWQDYSGEAAVRAETGRTFAEVAAARGANSANAPQSSETIRDNADGH
jgi:DNA modification methylase